MRHSSVLRYSCIPLLLLLGCERGSDSLYPLKEGRTWTYQATLDQYKPATLTMTNMESRDLKGQTVTPQKIELNDQTSFVFIGQDSLGVFESARQTPTEAEPEIHSEFRYYLHQPYTAGTQWEIKTETAEIYAGLPITVQAAVESSDATVTVPAGTFEGCAKVVGRGTGTIWRKGRWDQVVAKRTAWYCPGVGLVKAISYEKGGMTVPRDLAIQLESYSEGG